MMTSSSYTTEMLTKIKRKRRDYDSRQMLQFETRKLEVVWFGLIHTKLLFIMVKERRKYKPKEEKKDEVGVCYEMAKI